MWVTARFDVLFKSLIVTKRIIIFLAHFRFFKKATNLFNSTGHHVCSPTPTKISIDIFLPAAKTFGLNVAQPISQNDFNLFLLLVGGGCILSISPCWPLHKYPHRIVKEPHSETWTRPEPEPGLGPTFIFEAQFRPESQIYQGGWDMRNGGVTKNVCRYSCR